MTSKPTSKNSKPNQDFSYVDLDEDIRSLLEEHTCAIKSLMRRTAQDIIDIGLRLIEIKSKLGHGQFNAWLRSEIDLGLWTARKFMEIGRKFKSVNFTDLEIAPSALYLITSKKTPELAVNEILIRARQGEYVTHSTAKAIVTYHTNNNKQSNTDMHSKLLDAPDLQHSPNFGYGASSPDRLKNEVDLDDELAKFPFQVGSAICFTNLDQSSSRWTGKVSAVQVQGEVIRISIEINTNSSQQIPITND